jgi:signal transduction histidine kinase/CheY-like chemotaxis protein
MRMIRPAILPKIITGLVCCGCCWLLAATVNAAPVIEVNEDKLHLDLSPYVDVFEDKQGDIPFDEIRSENFSHQFSPAPLTHFYFGYTDSVYWLRYSVENQFDHDQSLVFEVTPADIDFVDFYGVADQQNQVLFHKHSGSAVDINQRDYNHPLYYFDLNIPAHSTCTYYVRLESNKIINAELALLTPHEHFHNSATRDWWQGLIFGGLLLLGTLHMGLAFVYKNKGFAYCGSMIFSMLLIQGSWNGYFLQFVTTDKTLLDRQLIISVYVAALFGLLFARTYLNTHQRSPFSHRLLTFLAIILLMGIPCSWLFDSHINAILVGAITVPTAFVVFGVGVYSFLEGYKPARYFLLARTLAIFMILIAVFTDRGLLQQGFVSAWGLSLAMIFEGMLFAFVMIRQQTQKIRVEPHTHNAADMGNHSMALPISALCHELRNSIAGVMGMTELLLDTSLTDQQRLQVETVRRSGKTLLDVVNKMSDLAVLERGDAELHESSFEIATVVESCIENARSTSEGRNIELIYQVDEVLGGLVKGDEQKLQQVLNHLISYFMRHLEGGEILLAAHCLSGDIVLFDIVSGKNTFGQQQGSSGQRHDAPASADNLNLTVAKQFVILLGGELVLKNRADGGLIASFQIPLRRQRQDSSIADHGKLLHGKRLLVVDDNDTCCKIIEQQASLWGMDVVTANSGKEALAILQSRANTKNVFDLMLVDYDMPGMNGVELIARMKAESDTPGISDMLVMVLTGASKVPAQAMEKQQGIYRVLYKPLSGKGLKIALLEAFQQSRVEKQ